MISARNLADAYRAGGIVPLPIAAAGLATRGEAFAVQDRTAELVGGPIAGRKTGATIRAVQLFDRP